MKFTKTCAAIFLLGLVLSKAKASQLDDWASSVVFLVADPSMKEWETATGFIIAGDDHHIFLATAAHVGRTLSEKSLVVVRSKNGIAFQIPMAEFEPKGTSLKWIFHEQADLAILQLNISPELHKRLADAGEQLKAMPFEVLRMEESAPERSTVLTMLGFPLELGVTGKFSPISKETKPASDLLTIRRGDTHEFAVFFITQDPSVGGFSGAPVFDTNLPKSLEGHLVLQSGGIRIVGVVHGTLSDNTGGKLGAITPAYELAKLLKAASGK